MQTFQYRQKPLTAMDFVKSMTVGFVGGFSATFLTVLGLAILGWWSLLITIPIAFAIGWGIGVYAVS